jgi:hypothetical protein
VPSFEAFIQLVHPDDRDGIAESWVKSKAPGHSGRMDSAYRVTRPDGSIRIISDHRESFCGEFTGLLGTVQDVTERRLLEGDLRQARQTESVGRLAGGIAHDFNTGARIEGRASPRPPEDRIPMPTAFDTARGVTSC